MRAEPIDLRISDSVLDATNLARAALSRPGGSEIAHAALTIVRSTVLGEIHTHVMRLAENCIFAGHTCVARRQIGCVRFCYVVPGSRTPRRYECQPDVAERAALEELQKLAPSASPEEKARAIARVRSRVRPQFNSMRYGPPVIVRRSAVGLTRGADDESEMGVFHDSSAATRDQPARASANLPRRNGSRHHPRHMGVPSENDITRATFHRVKHFSRVLMQQGRVQLDADWNEQVSILLHYLGRSRPVW